MTINFQLSVGDSEFSTILSEFFWKVPMSQPFSTPKTFFGGKKVSLFMKDVKKESYRQYSYSPTALGREPSEHECEANAGTFARK